MSIEKCIAEIEFRFPGIITHPETKKEWETLKAAALNPKIELVDCGKCGGVAEYHFCSECLESYQP